MCFLHTVSNPFHNKPRRAIDECSGRIAALRWERRRTAHFQSQQWKRGMTGLAGLRVAGQALKRRASASTNEKTQTGRTKIPQRRPCSLWEQLYGLTDSKLLAGRESDMKFCKKLIRQPILRGPGHFVEIYLNLAVLENQSGEGWSLIPCGILKRKPQSGKLSRLVKQAVQLSEKRKNFE